MNSDNVNSDNVNSDNDEQVSFNRRISDADARIRQADRLSKPIRILQCIQSNAKWDAASFANEFECSKRTVERYIDVLKYAGMPIYYDSNDRCYRLRYDIQFPVLNLSNEELLDQALDTAISSNIDIGSGTSRTTLEKVAARSDTETRDLINDAMEMGSSFDGKLADHSQAKDKLRTLQWALIERKQITGTYSSPYSDQEQTLTLHPYRLCFLRSAWYIIGRRHDWERPSVFRVVRFKTMKLLDRAAAVPDNFDLQDFLGNAWVVWRGETTYEVEILFSPEAASVVTETKWHHTQKVERHGDGSATLFFTVDGLNEIVWWLLNWAPFARVERPVELREMLVGQLERALDQNHN